MQGTPTYNSNIVREDCEAGDALSLRHAPPAPQGGAGHGSGVEALDAVLKVEDLLIVVLADCLQDLPAHHGAVGVPHEVHLVLGLLVDMVCGILETLHGGDSSCCAMVLGAEKPERCISINRVPSVLVEFGLYLESTWARI